MNLIEIKQAQAAAEDFIAEHGSHHASFDALTMMCFIEQTIERAKPPQRALPAKTPDTVEEGIPGWFIDALKPHAGRRVTASAVLGSRGMPTTMRDLRQAGKWLRELYGTPKMINGQTLYSVNMKNAVKDFGDDVQSPYNSALPISFRVKQFLKENEGRYTVSELAAAIGANEDPDTLQQIQKTLLSEKVEYKGAAFFIGGTR